MAKLDLKKTKLKQYYSGKPGEIVLVDVPKLQFLMIDGSGYPGTSQEYADAMGTLYPLSYTLKFNAKKIGKDYVVMPLEGLWWAENMEVFNTARDKSQWDWTMMILTPD